MSLQNISSTTAPVVEAFEADWIVGETSRRMQLRILPPRGGQAGMIQVFEITSAGQEIQRLRMEGAIPLPSSMTAAHRTALRDWFGTTCRIMLGW